MTPEGKVKERTKKLLKHYGAYYHMPVQNGMGAPSLDFVGCIKGRYFAIETKAGNKQPDERQMQTIKRMQLAGGRVFVVNEEHGFDLLELWLKETSNA